MEENHPLKVVRFFTVTYQLSWQNVPTILILKFFQQKFIANLPYNETEIVIFLEYVEMMSLRKAFFSKSESEASCRIIIT